MNYEEYFYLSESSPSGIRWLVNKGRARAGDCALTAIGNGYYKGRLNQKTVYAHRVAYYLHNGYHPHIVDHIDGNGLNNSIDNIRDGDKSLNNQNRDCKGYYYSKKDRVFCAQITTDSKTKHIGSYNSEIEAKAAYVMAKLEMHEFFNEERHK